MKVFLTGGAGFIGRRLIPALLARGHRLTVLLLPGESVMPSAGMQAVTGDITQAASLAGLLDGQDAVIHLAALVGYGQKMGPCMRVNAEGTDHLAAAAAAAGARRFVNLSSVAGYGRVIGRPITEDSPLRVTGEPYGDSKIAAERLLQRYQDSGRLDVTHVRPTVIYGPGDRLFLPKLLENARGGVARIIGDGRNRADLIHVDDVVRFLLRVLEEPASYGQAYTLTNSANGDWNTLIGLLLQLLGRPARIQRLPYPLAYALATLMELASRISGRPPRMSRYAVRVVGRHYDYVTDKARRQLGYVAEIGLAQGLADALKAP